MKRYSALADHIGANTTSIPPPRGPAEVRLGVAQTRDLQAPAAIGQACRCIHQQIFQRVPTASAYGPEPRIGELVGGEGILRAGSLDVGLAADYDLPGLPDVADLCPSGGAVRRQAKIVDGSPQVTEIDPGIGARPVVARDRTWWGQD